MVPLSDLLTPVLRQLESNDADAVARYIDFLRIPSVSTDPAFAGDIARAAAWLQDELTELGFKVEIRPTANHPVVIGKDHSAGPSAPHILYYAHYDVQPADPWDLWDSPPFEPVIVEAEHGPRVVARGAVDDKGQLRTVVEAMRAWKQVHGNFPVRITLLFEGEEEIGSKNLRPFLKTYKDELSADIAVITDTNAWDVKTPAITTSLRGLLYTELKVRGPSRDLHSGLYGGSAVNPIHVLTELVAKLHDEHGAITIPGFYDGVQPIDAATRAAWAALNFDEGRYLRDVGLDHSGGERNIGALERLWARPTCDVNGLWAGDTGVGAKTVIPSEAHAKISFRLIAGQEPEQIADLFRAFLKAHVPDGIHWELDVHSSARGFRLNTESDWLSAARRALKTIFGREAVLAGGAGSIPVVEWLKVELGLDSVMLGFGLEDDRIHSPNEKFELVCFRNGMKSHAAFLAELAAK
jgi:acetylornithine deacetylase/succinyl-diaminopimelate desuccinylase-like protein